MGQNCRVTGSPLLKIAPGKKPAGFRIVSRTRQSTQFVACLCGFSELEEKTSLLLADAVDVVHAVPLVKAVQRKLICPGGSGRSP